MLDQDSADPWELPPDEAREALVDFRDLMVEAADVAPDELQASVDYVAELNALVYDLFEAHDFDVADVEQAELDALEADMEALSADNPGPVYSEWVAANCSA